MRDSNAGNHVQSRCMPYMPFMEHVAVAGGDTNVSAQSRDHGLAFSWSSSMVISQRVLSQNLIDLSDCMVEQPLECESELNRIKMIYIYLSWCR